MVSSGDAALANTYGLLRRLSTTYADAGLSDAPVHGD